MTVIREKNDTGFYHITARGNGKQIIFNDENDYKRYLYLLKTHNKNLHIEILAYCLMSNHVHLLIYDPKFNMSRLIQRVHSLYTRTFNYKYDREGNLFQGRFDSKGIDNEKQLLAALRYVLKNPEEAGICKISEYKWSSYKFYGYRSNLVNTEKIENLLSSFSEYKKLINSKEIFDNYHIDDIDDDVLKLMVKQKFELEISTEVRSFSKKKRNDVIRFLDSKGASKKQIVRLTGISYGIILRVINKINNEDNIP